MLREEIHKWFQKLLSRGARPDVEIELREDGIYEMAQNMRPANVDGGDGSMKKIGGEVLREDIQPGDTGAGTYTCIGAVEVNGDRVTFWASNQPDQFPPRVKVNGVIMAESPQIPYLWNKPLQFGEVGRCPAGIIFPADRVSPPLFWDIGAMKQAYVDGTGEFFENFDVEAIYVQPQSPVEWPRHMGNPEIGQGAAAGQYRFSLRLTTPQGDRTNLGPQTPLISVALVQDALLTSANIGGRTTGGEPNVLVPTPYGIELKWRIDNPFGLSNVEVVVQRFNDGQGLNGPGITEAVARIPIDPGINEPFTFVYPRDNNFFEVIPPDEFAQQQVVFTAPGSVEHVDNRVIYADVVIEERIPELEFTEVNGQTFVPITRKVTTLQGGEEFNTGYTDPVNLTYLKSFARGERYGHGVAVWDGHSTKSFVQPIPGLEDYRFPNRRDPKTGLSVTESDANVLAATTQCQSSSPVGPTFEAYEQGSYKKQGGNTVSILTAQNVYAPLRPKSPTDPEASGWDINPSDRRFLTWSNSPPIIDINNWTADGGRTFKGRYHSLGLMLHGITNLPPWAKVLSFGYTAPAGRVVCQGLAMYDMQDAVGDNAAEKSTASVRFWSKDLEAGIVPEQVRQDVQTNPQNYEVQFVSPLGLYSEIYGHHPIQVQTGPNRFVAEAADMLCYAGIQHDEAYEFDPNSPFVRWSVNWPENQGVMGYQPTGGINGNFGNWVGYGKWRSLDVSGDPGNPQSYSYWHEQAEQGNAGVLLGSVNTIVEGRQTLWRLNFLNYVYPPGSQSTGGSRDFNDPGVRRFHRPWYVVNIIRRGASVTEQNVQQYRDTGYHVKVDACIGLYSGGIQTFELINERWEDCVPVNTTDIQYLWVHEDGLPPRAWMSAGTIYGASAYYTQAAQAIQDNGFWVAPDGTEVYGFYSFTQTDGRFSVTFGEYGQPASGVRINVRFNGKKVKYFGGDTTISPAVFLGYDRLYNAFDPGGANTFKTGGLPLPFPGFIKRANYFTPILPTYAIGNSPDPAGFITSIRSIRQMAVMFDTESRVPGVMDTMGDGVSYSFPRQHYKLRLYAHNSSLTAADQGVYPQYDLDYPNEWTRWGYGGFPFEGDQNFDYARPAPVSFLGVPRNGRARTGRICTAHLASQRFDPVQTDAPGLRTFLYGNMFVISEENGGVQRIASLDQGGFQHLWGWTQNGVYKIPYNKAILVGAAGDVIGTQSIDNFWPREEMWIVRGSKGMPGELWRISAKANAPVEGGDIDTMFWADDVSAYQLVGGRVVDIARGRFLSVLQPFLSQPTNGDLPYSGVFNHRHSEWWLSLPGLPEDLAEGRTTRLLVFGARNREWIGKYTYDYDQYLSQGTGMWGYRRMRGFSLDDGFTIGRDPVEAWVEVSFTPHPTMQSELVAWRVAPDKPDELRVYDRNKVQMVITNEAIQEAFQPGTGELWVTKIDSWQAMMNSVDATYDPSRATSPQDTGFFVRIYYRSGIPQRITFAQVQAKQIP